MVPKPKLLRASEAIRGVLRGEVDFQTYRSLCGLLEHLLSVVLRGRNVMHGLYQPHGPEGASKDGPSTIVECTDLMRKQLERWQRLLVHAGGVSVKRSLSRSELETLPTLYFDLTSDACYAEVRVAGIAGFMHGLYWYFPVPEQDRPLLSIPILEFLGVCFNVLVFHSHLVGFGEGANLLLRTDALTAARTLPKESMRSPLLVAAYQWLIEQEEWESMAPRLIIQHIFGDCNALSDLASRAKWEAFNRLCAQLGIRPQAVPLAAKCEVLYRHIMGQLIGDTRGARSALFSEALELGSANNGAGAHEPFAHFDEPLSTSPSAIETLRALAACPPRLEDLGRQPGAVPLPTPSPTTVAPTPASPSAIDTLRALAARPAGEAGPPSASVADMVGAPAGKRRLMLGAVALPPAPPKRPRHESSLTAASQWFARARILAMTQGGEPGMALRTNIADLMNVGEAIDELIEFGVNANTWDKDSRAWDMWVAVCDAHGCSPMRTASEARDFPERNAHLLAALMFHAFATCKPRDARRMFIKPRSALAYPLAIIRIFARWSVPMPSYKMLKAALNGIARMYVGYHGPYSMAPRRSEPMKFSMVRTLDAIPEGATVGDRKWSDADHDTFMFRRLNRVMIVTAFRLGEIVHHASGEIMYLTFESLVWSIGGVLIEDPTPAQLRSMRSGIDGARLAPPRSKPDQWGEIHCPFSVVLTYEAHDPINAAAALRDVELRCKVHGAARATTPLFHQGDGEPYSHHYLHHMLRAAIAYCYGKAAASLYSWHSYRSGLATALHAAGVDDAMIQLICRWMCPESLHVYRRMGVGEHERLIKRATAVDVDLIQTTNAPRVFADQGYAELVGSMAGSRGAAEQAAYDAALRAALDPYRRSEGERTEGGPPPQATTARPARRTPGRALAAAERQEPAAPIHRVGARVTDEVQTGTAVAVLHSVWPDFPCTEMDGLAWHATVVTKFRNAATVRFTHARTRGGRRYEDVRLALDVLRLIA